MMLFVWTPSLCLAVDDVQSVDHRHLMTPVVVTATRSPIGEQDVSANITVVTSEQLHQMPATTVAQALEYLPGVSVQFNGGPGSDAGNVRIQGSEIRHVAIYQDGVPLTQLVNPRTDLSYLPLNSVERIEIYKGAASSAWGSALGGVINIVTQDPSPNKPVAVDVRGAYGTQSTLKSGTHVDGMLDNLGWLLSYTHEQSDGFIEHTDYKIDALNAKINYDVNNTSRIQLALSHNQGQNADPIVNWAQFSSEPFWDDIERQLDYQRLFFEFQPASGMVMTLEGYHRQSDSTIEDVYPDRREQFQDYEEQLWGGSARLDWSLSKISTLLIGFDGDWGRFKWKPFMAPMQIDHTGDSAVFANNTLKLGNAAINAGIRYDNNWDYGSAVSPSFGIAYNCSSLDAVIRAQVAKGFSAPDYAWVHDPELGNPNLSPEYVVNYQLGGEVHLFDWLQMELNLFRAEVEDLIRFDRDANTYINEEKVNRRGFEWTLATHFDAGLSIRVGGSHADVRNATTDEVIQDIPRTQYNVSLLYAQGGMSHSLFGKYIDNNSSYKETQDKVMLFDYRLEFKLPAIATIEQWAAYGAIYNLFNTSYLYRDVWPQPGRQGEIGIQLTL
jgi:vitamin B12 transporter